MVWHISRSSGLAKTILKGTVIGKEVDRRRGGKAILRAGQRRSLKAQPGLLNAEPSGKGSL